MVLISEGKKYTSPAEVNQSVLDVLKHLNIPLKPGGTISQINPAPVPAPAIKTPEYLEEARRQEAAIRANPAEIVPPGVIPGVSYAVPGPVPAAAPAPAGTTPAIMPPAVTPTAFPGLPAPVSERAKLLAALEPQRKEAISRITSQVNPYMTGRIGAGLLEEVEKPTLQALTEYDLAQPERERANLIEQIQFLAPLATAVGATPEARAYYQQALTKLIGPLGEVAGPAGVPGLVSPSFLPTTSTAALQGQLTALENKTGKTAEDYTRLNILANQIYGTTGQRYYNAPTAMETAGSAQEALYSTYGPQLAQAESTLGLLESEIGDYLQRGTGQVGNINDFFQRITEKQTLIKNLNQAKNYAEIIDRKGYLSEANMQSFLALISQIQQQVGG